MDALQKIFSEGGGKPSSMRVLVFLVIVAITGTWSYVCIMTKTMAAFPAPAAATVVGALWMKQAQRGKEGNATGA